MLVSSIQPFFPPQNYLCLHLKSVLLSFHLCLSFSSCWFLSWWPVYILYNKIDLFFIIINLNWYLDHWCGELRVLGEAWNQLLSCGLTSRESAIKLTASQTLKEQPHSTAAMRTLEALALLRYLKFLRVKVFPVLPRAKCRLVAVSSTQFRSQGWGG